MMSGILGIDVPPSIRPTYLQRFPPVRDSSAGQRRTIALHARSKPSAQASTTSSGWANSGYDCEPIKIVESSAATVFGWRSRDSEADADAKSGCAGSGAVCQRTASTPSARSASSTRSRSEEHTSELQSHHDLVCRLLLEK